MRICRFDNDRLGVVIDDVIADVSEALEQLPAERWARPLGDPVIAHWATLEPVIRALLPGAKRTPLRGTRLNSPVATPSKIIGIARNRRNLEAEHIDIKLDPQSRTDADGVRMFIKANSALSGPSDGLEIRFPERRTDPEAEFTIVIAKKCTDVSYADAMEYVFGYTIGLDTTMRGKESPSSRKSFDTFASAGPCIATRDEIADPDNVESTLSINGKIVQSANTSSFAFDVRSIVAHASSFYTLYPGDLIMAGTPPQFEEIHPGDVMVATFAGIGSMEVAVRAYTKDAER